MAPTDELLSRVAVNFDGRLKCYRSCQSRSSAMACKLGCRRGAWTSCVAALPAPRQEPVFHRDQGSRRVTGEAVAGPDARPTRVPPRLLDGAIGARSRTWGDTRKWLAASSIEAPTPASRSADSRSSLLLHRRSEQVPRIASGLVEEVRRPVRQTSEFIDHKLIVCSESILLRYKQDAN